ncbi:hypothetical protein [Hugenholtzia roseola]|uniref:hypothetical protein n=1 Tax=Hugenholtzia roseola TaxID=1002 RepID=UPI0003F6DAD8|nr:hypothetical protein [Hugenholtzia roseola]
MFTFSYHLIKRGSLVLRSFVGIFALPFLLLSCQSEENPLQKTLPQSGELRLTKAAEEDFTKFFNRFSKESLSNLESMLHPNYGVFVVYKPSTYAITQHFGSLSEATQELPYLSEYFEQLPKDTELRRQVPNFNCEQFAQEGTFYEDVASPMVLSKVAETAKLLGREIPSQQQNLATALDKQQAKTVVLTNQYLALAFANIEGKWYLVLIDTARFDCAA